MDVQNSRKLETNIFPTRHKKEVRLAHNEFHTARMLNPPKPLRIRIFRLPALGLALDPLGTKLKPTYPYPTTTNTPIISQATVAAIIQEEFSKNNIEADIRIVDMRAIKGGSDKLKAEEYKTIRYGQALLRCYRVASKHFDDVKDQILDSDVICLTALFTAEAGITKDFISFCKDVNPKLKIVIGGKDATARPGFYREAGANIVVCGYGEENIREVVSALTKKEPSISVAGEYALPVLNLVEGLNYYSEAHGGGYNYPDGVSGPAMFVSFSRGCMHACNFCATSGEHYSPLGPDQAEKILQHYRKYGIKVLFSNEDNFLLRMDRRVMGLEGRDDIIRIMRRIREMDFAFEFSNGLQMGLLGSERNGKFTVDEELLEELFKHYHVRGHLVGTFRLHWPLETFDTSTAEDQRLKKLRGWEQTLQLIESVSRLKIPQIAFGIIVFYNNGIAQIKGIKKRVSEIKRLVKDGSEGCTRPYFSVLNEIILPGTRNFTDPSRTQLIRYSIDKYPELWGPYTPAYDGTELTMWELFRIRRRLAINLNTNHALVRGPPLWTEST